ncbi:MAG: glycosyltransferase [Chlamydiales bacterium]|nr:glycosyltransferase [Chlamydiales bacterium]
MWLILLLMACFSTLSAKMPGQTDFVVVIPSYNNEKYCIANLQSLVNQNYPYWTAIYINDCSTDKTGAMVDDFVKTHNLGHKIKVVHNKKNVGAMANFYKWINKINPQHVVVHLDGDDRLAHPQVLEKLAYTYADKNVWMTYGSYRPEPDDFVRVCAPFPEWVLKKNAFRKYAWVSSHLRSYYAKLFHNIKKKHFLYKGKFAPMACDLAIMFPVLEQSSKNHIRYISEELYIYNYNTPINDVKKDLSLILDVDKRIRKMSRYKPLKTLF